jgi:hypothetical protein
MQSPAYLRFLGCMALSSFLATIAQAQVGDKPDARVREVRAASREYVASNERGDSKSLGQMWTKGGDYIDVSGRVFNAKQLLAVRSEEATTEVVLHSLPSGESTIRFITNDVAIEDGTSEAGSRFTAIWVKQDGRWLLDSLRESIHDAPQGNEKLKSLAWLLGEWAANSGDTEVLVSSHWSDDGKYIVREFLARADGRGDISATQRIGADSATGKIRCWTFDSNGGTSEGTWRQDGERWLVDTKEVLADGKTSKTSTVYVPRGDGTFVSETTSALDAGNGESAVKLSPLRVEFKRAAEVD